MLETRTSTTATGATTAMRRTALLVLTALLLLSTAPCTARAHEIIESALFTPDHIRPPIPEEKPGAHPKIEATLYQLVGLVGEGHWDQAEAYARACEVTLQGRRVRVVLEGDSGATAALASAARAKGLIVEATYRNRVQILAPIASLLDVAGLPSVRHVRLPCRPHIQAVTSEGVTRTGADLWQAAGYGGSGVKVAILDLGFKDHASLIASGELPADVVTQSFRSDGDIEAGEVHGSACAEIVHDMAPDAQLYLINYATDVEFGNAVDYAIAQGVRVASSSVGWLGAGSFDGTGPICDIVNHARDWGVFWAQSAGNSANRHWEGSWNDPDSNDVHNFSSGDESQSFVVAADTTIYANLVWNDAWSTSSNDYDLYLQDSGGQTVASSVNRQDGDDTPNELIAYDVGSDGAGTYHLEIRRYSATGIAYFDLYSFRQVFEYQTPSSSLLIPADAEGAVAAGATYWSTDALEIYSSLGPTNDGRIKPEFTAPDGVTSAAYGSSFFGTSAAAPHLAGAAVLVMGAYPSYSVTDTVTFLTQRAVDLGPPGQDNLHGHGRVSLGPATATPTPTHTSSATPTHTPTASPTATPAGSETTITLQQGASGYSGCSDTYIYQYAPDAWYRWQDVLKVGYKQQNAALIRFDLASIPTGATITEAALQIYATGWSGSDITLGAYSILRNSDPNQATWNQAQTGSHWTQPGCNNTISDRQPAPESSLTTSSIATWYDFDLTALVQDWVDGTLANNGVLLRATYSTYSFRFASAQSAADRRPKLVITFISEDGPTSTTTATPTSSATPTPTPTATATLTPSPTPDEGILILGHITDPHIGFGPLESLRLPVVVSVVSQQAQVMVDTGDCTDNGTAEESIEYMDLVTSSVTIPWRVVIGNHDSPDSFQTYIAPLEWSWDVGSFRLIGINTEAINYAALDQVLTTERTCVIFGHFPLDYCTPADQVKLRERFLTYNIPIYIAGHIHENSLDVDPYSGTLLLTGERTVRGHYRLITLHDFEVDSIEFKSAY